MHDHGIYFHCFEENGVSGNTITDFWIVRIHKAAAILDDESGAAEFLNVGQRFEQRLRFGNQIVHKKSNGPKSAAERTRIAHIPFIKLDVLFGQVGRIY